eukprot:TRINITY_DN37742_c0_g1_i1.p1 TRINITY_DN37742_c0_g1~~TRINITY_DN37742_c0_g1_i1.p1  ORF type:complete len:650 (-),score=99.35 TRINITY_DN37742_c0_g1_i1:128-2077(-)
MLKLVREEEVPYYAGKDTYDELSSADDEAEYTDDWTEESVDVAKVAALQEQLIDIKEKERASEIRLKAFDELVAGRRAPITTELEALKQKREELTKELEVARQPVYIMPPPPGPDSLSWVNSDWFGALCMIIVAVNLTCMFLARELPNQYSLFQWLDQIFLLYYVFELTVKGMYFQRTLLIGRCSVIWWNWLDLAIVVSGILDQWVLPILTNACGISLDTSWMRMLRVLRLFRVLRVLRLCKVIFMGNLDWVEGQTFELFMSGVIVANSFIIALELDNPCKDSQPLFACPWTYVDNALLMIYVFEWTVKVKHFGCYFFYDKRNLAWNYLDTVVVFEGIIDQWMIPIFNLCKSVLLGQPAVDTSNLDNMKLLKLLRLLRVLRLVRLIRTIKPLYLVLVGVVQSMRAMQWVLLMTLLVLYAGAILFTSLIGQGIMYSGTPPPEAEEFFGSVPASLFSLFKLMNGDTSVVEPITNTVSGQLLFAGFMVVSNWAVLAILTSVVSDNMIATSAKHTEETEAEEAHEEHLARINRLKVLFAELALNESGAIYEKEWVAMLEDPQKCKELSECCKMSKDDLMDLFLYLEEKELEFEIDGKIHVPDKKFVRWTMIVDHLIEEGTMDRFPSDKRSINQVKEQLRRLEKKLDRQFNGRP